MQPKTIAILGAGDRGQTFSNLIRQYSHLGVVTAVADVRPEYRRSLAEAWNIPSDRVFDSWEAFVAKPKMCDAVVIATTDRQHVGPAVACLDKGCDLLVEKPMGVTLEECRAIEAAQRRSKSILGVCHSLRYHKAFRKLRDLAASGAIGRIITVDQIEQVELQHHAHSFVRGNWANESRSTFMLMSKSCHDIDYIAYLIGKPCIAVSSFGNLTYFRKENAPPGAPDRCTDGCPHEPTCLFSSLRQYIHADRTKWPAAVISHDHSVEAHMQALRAGPYGRCAWKCDNDVVDHQVVAMQFAEDVTATFTMTAFTHGGGRRVRVHGTEGEMLFDEKSITIHTFADRNTQRIDFGAEPGGHGGGDARVVREWLAALHSRDDSNVVANAQESLRTHSIVFAAEKSRREGRLIRLADL